MYAEVFMGVISNGRRSNPDSHANAERTLLAYLANRIGQRERTAVTIDRACS